MRGRLWPGSMWLAAVRRVPLATLRRVPLAAYVCAAIACLNGIAWSMITPPFQVSDETSHFAYVQQLAENHTLPTSRSSTFSLAERVALEDLHVGQVQLQPLQRTISTPAEQQQLEFDITTPYSRRGTGGAGLAASEPPLYYAIETIPYRLGSGGTILDQLALMRLVSALMGGVTALLCFMFVREAVPGVRWAWTVGGVAVASFPLLGFMSGAVNPDALLYVVVAGLFFVIARAFRRGLSPRLALALGLLTAAGFVTKLNFIGLAPGVFLALLILALRRRGDWSRGGLLCLAVAVGIAVSPVCVRLLANASHGESITGAAAYTTAFTGERRSLGGALSFMWQFFLPRLPGMHRYFSGIFTARRIWFDGVVGKYGWLDTTFPTWVYSAALVPLAVILALMLRAGVIARARLRGRVSELLVYAVMSAGLLALVGLAGYDQLRFSPGEYAQPRYLLPLLPLLGVSVALAARGAGRRYGPVVGTLLIVLFLAHDLYSQMLVLSRYYL